MLKRIAAALAIALTAGALTAGLAPAQAHEALALKVLGFSPDGRYFGFVQYGGQGDHSEWVAETYVIDVNRDRFVSGVPVRLNVEVKDDPDEGKELRELLAAAAKRAAPVTKRHNLSAEGKLLLRVDEARTTEPHSGSGGPTTGAKTASVKHPVLGDLELKLDDKEMVWPKTSRFGAHKGAALCSSEVDWQKGAAFRLTLQRGGRTIVLNDDKTIPASRFCAMGYGIAEVHTFDRPDGKVVLAVILGMHNRGFEGEDRSFLAVTKVLDR